MVFSHKETLARVDGLRLVNHDVGRGRAWLRLALNEGLLSSYLSAMSRDKVTARRHYQREAVVRDTDTLDQMARQVLCYIRNNLWYVNWWPRNILLKVFNLKKPWKEGVLEKV